MTKFIEHNCLVWNSKQWKCPSLDTRSNYSANPPSFAAQYGFGHEEWNNTELYRVGAWRGFYTTAHGGPVGELAASQRVGIIMTSRQPDNGQRCLVGAAVDVRPIDEKLKQHLKKRSKFGSQAFWPELAVLEEVKDRRLRSRDPRKLSLRALLNIDVPWMCRVRDFWWAEEEYPLRSIDLTTASGSPLTWRWAQSQPLKNPYKVRKILADAGCKGSILEWFSDDEEFVVRSTATFKNAGAGSDFSWRRTGSAASSPYRKYVDAYEVEIQPQHEMLKESFVRFGLTAGFMSFDGRHKSVDLVGQHSIKGRTFIEIKPAPTPGASRFAVRLAVGQLLEYRFYERASVKALVIVVGCRPPKRVIAFARSHGIGCAWPVSGGSFEIAWA
ncbi:MAG: hypothetical protein K2X72_03080 [Reyranella sp.]|nr:hypothetical protein [Reyranella sp.]